MKNSLLCIVHNHDGKWEAICLDLDISVEGRSMHEAKNTLRAAIRDYIDLAMQEDEPHRTALLNRKAPLSVRLAWAIRLAYHALCGVQKDDESGSFVVPCHA